MEKPSPQTLHNSKAIVEIARMIEELPYGSITFTLRMHDGFVTDIMEQSYKRKRLKIDKDS